jgi:Flp pilus assembly pilin Flp
MAAISITPLYRNLYAKFHALTLREKAIIAVAVAVAIAMLLYRIYEPINRIFTSQNDRIATLEAQLKALPPSIERYAKLKARRDAIEEEYKSVDFKEGALSYLENLVRNTDGVQPGFTIKDNPPKEFGGNYEQTLFQIKFISTNLESLVNFLKEVIHGSRPLIISKIDIQKSKYADRLEVDIDASSIRRIK